MILPTLWENLKLNMAIEIADLPIILMVIVHSYD